MCVIGVVCCVCCVLCAVCFVRFTLTALTLTLTFVPPYPQPPTPNPLPPTPYPLLPTPYPLPPTLSALLPPSRLRMHRPVLRSSHRRPPCHPRRGCAIRRTTRSVTQSVSQSVIQSISQSVSQSVSQSCMLGLQSQYFYPTHAPTLTTPHHTTPHHTTPHKTNTRQYHHHALLCAHPFFLPLPVLTQANIPPGLLRGVYQWRWGAMLWRGRWAMAAP